MYYCICPVCMCVCVLFVFCLSLFDVLVHYCCLVILGPTQNCCWDHPPFEIPKTTTACRGYLWSWYTTVAGSVSFFFDLLTLLLGNWFWYTTAVRPTIHRGNTLLCCPNLVLGSAILLEPHTNPVRSRGAHPRGCSRASFPVDVPSIGAAAAALMGMVTGMLRLISLSDIYVSTEALIVLIESLKNRSQPLCDQVISSDLILKIPVRNNNQFFN